MYHLVSGFLTGVCQLNRHPVADGGKYLQQNLDSVISAAFFANVPTVTTEVDYVYYHTMKISDLDAFTQKVFGYTYDYTGVVDLWVM